jgi:uncharacterized phiE125 gp8 family phage protein
MNEPTVITAPLIEPVSLADARTALAIDSAGSQDKLLSTYISAARRYFEWRTGRTVHQTTYEWTRTHFPAIGFRLPRATPLISIDAFTYKDDTGAVTAVPAADYIADTDSTPGRVVLAYGKSWPSFTAYPSNPIRIRYTAGLASSPVQDAAEDIQLPILLLTAHFYENPIAVLAVERGTPGQIVLAYALEHYLEKLQVEYVF